MTQLERNCDKNDDLCGILKKQYLKHSAWCTENKKACRKKIKAKKRQERWCNKHPDECVQDIGLSSFPEEQELEAALSTNKKAESE